MQIVTYPSYLSQIISQTTTTATGSGIAGVITGSGIFAGELGYTIHHLLGNQHHATFIEVAGENAFSADSLSDIGQIYVKLGVDQDIVYNTGGVDSYGVPFCWLSTTQTSGTSVSGSTVTSHSHLTDLDNDDHTQYWLANGSREISGHIMPNMVGASGVVSAYNIGSSTQKINTLWAHDVRVDAGSLYVNDKKVIEDVSDTITISTDPDQDLALRTYATGDTKVLSEHQVINEGRDGVEINVPSTHPSKQLTLNNYSTNGDISISSAGVNGNVFFLAYDTVDIIAETFSVNANIDITGTLDSDGYTVSGIAPAGKYLRGDGSKFTYSDILESDFPSSILTEQNLLTTSGDLVSQMWRNPLTEPLSINVTSAVPSLTVTQSGVGKSFVVNDGSVETFGVYDGGKVGINATFPNEALEVSGNVRTSGVFKIGATQVLSLGNGPFTGNLFVGSSSSTIAHSAGTEGYYNVGVGLWTLPYLTTGQGNVCVGYAAGASINTGYRNILIGFEAGEAITSSTYNVGIGQSALKFNTSGASNFGFGAGSLRFNQTGSYNIAIGTEAGYGVPENSHYNNVFIGYQSGYRVTTGYSNLCVGFKSGYNITSSYNNTFVGDTAGYSTSSGLGGNTFIGKQAGYNNLTGDGNLAIGIGALYSNSVYNRGQVAIGNGALNHDNNPTTPNTAVGFQSLYTNVSGYGNTALGCQTLYSNINGYANIAMGEGALFYNTYGNNNVAIGVGALGQNVNGNNNIAIGLESMSLTLAGSYNTSIGVGAGKGVASNTYSNCTFIGWRAGVLNTTGANNTAIGRGAAYYNQTGADNVTIGYQAGGAGAAAINSNSNNTVVGSMAGYSLTTGSNNAILGYQAGYTLSSGSSNLFLGSQAGFSNIEGQSNICIGYQAGYSNTVSYHVFIGNNAGRANTTGTFNVFIGEDSGRLNNQGSYNMALGAYSLSKQTSASYNTAIGSTAGYNNVTGVNNIYIGCGAGYGSSGNSHSNNTFIGYNSGYCITTGSNNVGVSAYSCNALTTGGGNVVIGYYAMVNNQTGGNNTLIGDQAGRGSSSNSYSYNSCVGNISGWSLTTGGYNTCFGYASGYTLTSGTTNVFIGASAGKSALDSYGNVCIGYGAGYYETGSEKLFIDNRTRASEADARAKALIYGVFNADPIYQTVTINGDLGTTGKFGANNAPPSAALAHVADPAGGGVVDAEARSAINSILTTLETFGFHLTS